MRNRKLPISAYAGEFPEQHVRPVKLLTTREVADYLGLSPETVLRRWRSGALPGFRLASNCLRFDQRELERWLDERRRESVAR